MRSSPPGQNQATIALGVSEPPESAPRREGGGERGLAEAPPRLASPRPAPPPGDRAVPGALPGCAAAMGKAAGNEAYFQRGSPFWFTVITLSFGYYTVKAERGAKERSIERRARACVRGRQSRRRNSAPLFSEPRETSPERDAGALVGKGLSLALQALRPATQAFPVWGGGCSAHHSSVSTSFKMVVAKSEGGRAATTYFRTARPLPSLFTALALGYFAVRRGGAGHLFGDGWPSEGEGL